MVLFGVFVARDTVFSAVVYIAVQTNVARNALRAATRT